MNKNAGLFAMLTSMVFWGFGNPFSDYAVQVFSSGEMFVVEVGTGTIGFFAIVLLVPRIRGNIGRIPWKICLPLGFIMPGFCYYLGNIGYKYGTVTTGVILMSCEAIFMAVGGVFVLKESLPLKSIAAVCLGMLGVIVVGISGQSSNPETLGLTTHVLGFTVSAGLVGAGAFLLSGALSAAFGLLVRKYASTTDVVGLTLGQLVSAFIFAVIIMVTQHVDVVSLYRQTSYFWAATAAGMLGIAFAFLLFNQASENVTARQTALLLNLIPVIAITIGAIIGRGLPTPVQAIGAVIVLVSLFALETKELEVYETPA